jgi:hypothetical protein
MKKAIVIAAAVLFMSPKVGRAQFGFGGIVYDPTNFHNAVLRYYQLRLQLAQLQATYQQVLSQYNLAIQMAKNIENMPARYRAYFSQWRNLTTVPDLYQNTGTWVSAANSGNLSTALTGYKQATTQLDRYATDSLTSMPPEDRERILANYATVELADGVNTNSLATIGNLRADAVGIQSQVANLEQDSFSSDPQLNTEIGVLNKINAANVLTLRTLQDANNLRLAELEQQVLNSKRARDAMTTAINAEINQRQNLVPQVARVTDGLGSSLANFRLP